MSYQTKVVCKHSSNAIFPKQTWRLIKPVEKRRFRSKAQFLKFFLTPFNFHKIVNKLLKINKKALKLLIQGDRNYILVITYTKLTAKV